MASDKLKTSNKVFALAVPVMISNISTPLIGVVDTAIVGQSPDPSLIGAVAISAMLFSLLYWGFGFLRMGTTSLTAQSIGACEQSESRAILMRALIVSLATGFGLIALQTPISALGFFFLKASSSVEFLSKEYFDIRIWSAPATFINYALVGWFIGLGRARIALLIQLILNFLNAFLDWYFVIELGMGVKGVALGTLFAEFFAATIGLIFAVKIYLHLKTEKNKISIWDFSKLRKLFNVSTDIMVRSLALIFVFVWFTSQSAKNGDLVLAANAILMHFITTTAYFLDGFAIAAESLAGRAIGAKSRKDFVRISKVTLSWSAIIAALASIVLIALGPNIIRVLTVDTNIQETAIEFMLWAALAPLIATWCYQLDGIFLGATWTREMVKSMLISTSLFLLVYWVLLPLQNTGLWLSLYFHFAARAVTLGYYFPRLLNRDFPSAKH